jgi:hypothetical protein
MFYARFIELPSLIGIKNAAYFLAILIWQSLPPTPTESSYPSY